MSFVTVDALNEEISFVMYWESDEQFILFNNLMFGLEPKVETVADAFEFYRSDKLDCDIVGSKATAHDYINDYGHVNGKVALKKWMDKKANLLG